MSAAHTPGPWTRTICKVDKQWLKGLLVEGVVSEQGIVAVCGEGDADARLIAAAPRMLEALKRAAHILAEIDQATAPAVLTLRTEIVASIKDADPDHYGGAA